MNSSPVPPTSWYCPAGHGYPIEAVYRKMPPRPRLRFLLADDPGAGKTIYGRAVIKELKLREAIERSGSWVPRWTASAGLCAHAWSDACPRTPALVETVVQVGFTADRDQLYSAWNAIANLADMAGEVTVSIRAESEVGFDKSKLQNGVLEPLREAGLIE